MNTAEYIVKRLEELGVNDFFGVSGDYSFNLLYAVKSNPGTKWIGCTNELNAAYAADGYARVRGYGAIITNYGGELSTMNAIAGSMAENVPVVNIVGLPSTDYIEKDTQYNLRDVDYKAYMNSFSAIGTASAFLNKDNAKQEIDRVLKIMVKDKKPAYIAVPADIAKLPIDDTYTDYNWAGNKDTLNTAALRIAEKISKSKRPIIIGDALIKRFDAEIEYREFVKHSEIPVSNFLGGLNIVDMDYEKYIGGYFGNYRNPIAQKYIESSDCVIAIGTIYNELNAFGFDLAQKVNNGIAIYGTKAYVSGKLFDNIKMSELLEAVTAIINPKNVETDRPMTGLRPQATDGMPLTTDYIYYRIQNFIKENDIVITETGSAMHGVAQMKFPPSVDIQFRTIWGSIGWATPATLGACIAKPKSRVVLITGDGAHQQTCMEIGTILRNNVKPIIIVINNKGYAAERLFCRDSKDKINDVAGMNYSKFARVFDGDVWSTKVDTPDDFDKALKVTQIMNKMCYIEVCTDYLDTPQLTQDIVYSVKDHSEYEAEPEEPRISDTEEDNKEFNVEEMAAKSSANNFAYETIVHKVLIDNNNSEGSNNG